MGANVGGWGRFLNPWEANFLMTSGSAANGGVDGEGACKEIGHNQRCQGALGKGKKEVGGPSAMKCGPWTAAR